MAFALTYRPRTLAQVYGQRSATLLTQALIERLRSDAVTLPGLLLTGPRGAGKTTVARLIAAGLNCDADYPDAAHPCGDCGPCDEVAARRYEPVTEIDGATLGASDGHARVRALARLVRSEHYGRFRVVIIDECHAMSPEALSALLVQIEEPPRRVVYILVTTAYDAVPIAIASRCLSIPFTIIENKEIVSRLEDIAHAEHVTVDPDALAALAAQGHGSLRDALIALEQIAAITPHVTLRHVETLWPPVGRQFAVSFFASIEAGDSIEGMRVIGDAFAHTHSSRTLFDAIQAFLIEKAQTSTRERARRIADLIAKLYDIRIDLRRAEPTDPVPVQALWFVFQTMLTKALPVPADMALSHATLAEQSPAGTPDGNRDKSTEALSQADLIRAGLLDQ